jgi:undecaprenyl-diphosphatase
VAGGDGTLCAGAAAAAAAGKPMLALPAGTLNHFARDLGLFSVDDALSALRGGTAGWVDVGEIDGRPFLNTASWGSYTALVDAREKLEDRIGKWPAVIVALVSVLRRDQPVEAVLDGRPRRLWMGFAGNCRYRPDGFAPSWRERLDDGRLDVRLIDAHSPLARTRLVLAVLSGRLGRCRVYSETTARELRVETSAPIRLSRDGETFDASGRSFTVTKSASRLAVYRAAPTG